MTGAAVKHLGATSFVGGCTEDVALAGRFALTVSAMDFVAPKLDSVSGELTATKAWYFVDEGAVAMVHNVALNASGQAVVTTLDQSLLGYGVNAAVNVGTADGQVTTLPIGNHSLANVNFVHHNAMLYSLNPGKVKVNQSTAHASMQTKHTDAVSPLPRLQIRNGPQEGRWTDINANSGPPGSRLDESL